MARYATTMKAIENGLENTKPAQGVKAIDDWIEQVQGTDKRGVKGLARDLERLKKELERDEPREDAVRKTLAKLGQATEKLADQAEGANVEKLKEIGRALTEQAQGHEADAEEEEDA